MGVVKLYMDETVLEAARKRIRWLYTEFEHIYVSFSGGKDSTVVLNLALEVAEEMGRLPVPVVFLDQEAEWQTAIDYIRTVMNDPRVDARWLQIPFHINNAASISEPYLYCWDPACPEKWMRPKEPDSYHDNVYGVDLFLDLFDAYLQYHHPRTKVASLLGLRCQESPGRTLGLTGFDSYKGVTWGALSKENRPHFHFSPIYDWSYTDVWKYIHESGVPYCHLYDLMYQYGIPIAQMRVSNVTHEQATRSLYFLQELEPQTWNKLTERCGGINSIGQMKASFYTPKELPKAFANWVEYRDYLLVHLTDDEGRKTFARDFPWIEKKYIGAPQSTLDALVQAQITAILRNDWEGGSQGLDNFIMTHPTPKREAARKKAKEAAAAAALATPEPTSTGTV